MSLVDRVGGQVVGRRRELELLVAALMADRHIVLEGPPGTGKSTLLRAVAHELGLGFEFVEGNAELTPARLVGHFDPARVLTDGYSPDVFVDGPLVTAMTNGSLLYVEEINRIPEETLNVLITVMSEQELHVPRFGRIACEQGFRLVAAMNPFDAVGTARISSAVYDRMCRLSMTYQSAEDEIDIVRRAVGADAEGVWLEKIVELVRLTRQHPDLPRRLVGARCDRHRRGVDVARRRPRPPGAQPERRPRLGDHRPVRSGPAARRHAAHERGDHHRAVADGVRPRRGR